MKPPHFFYLPDELEKELKLAPVLWGEEEREQAQHFHRLLLHVGRPLRPAPAGGQRLYRRLNSPRRVVAACFAKFTAQ